MPYSIHKEGKKWRIHTPTKALPPHYKSKASAKRVVNYLRYKEGKKHG